MSSANAANVLLVAAAKRDRAAFERLYKLCAPRLFGLCVRMLRRREVAEEVLQEGFLQIWRDAPRFDPDRAEAFTWMARIVRNRALDTLRRRATTPTTGARSDAGAHETMSPDPGPLELAIAGADRGALGDCLDELSDEQRRSILLAFVQGLSHSELSDALATPMGTVKSWIRRGLARLKQCLES